MNNFMKVMCLFLGIPTEKKEKLDPGVLGTYDCKPYDTFHYSLIYARNTLVFDDGKTEIFSRVYKNTTFVNVLVNDDEGFDALKFDYPHLREMLRTAELPNTDKSIVFIAFKNANENTIKACKTLCKSDKNNFIQGATFNPHTVHMDYYKPVPEFYKLFYMFCVDLYLDFAFIDHVKEA